MGFINTWWGSGCLNSFRSVEKWEEIVQQNGFHLTVSQVDYTLKRKKIDKRMLIDWLIDIKITLTAKNIDVWVDLFRYNNYENEFYRFYCSIRKWKAPFNQQFQRAEVSDTCFLRTKKERKSRPFDDCFKFQELFSLFLELDDRQTFPNYLTSIDKFVTLFS